MTDLLASVEPEPTRVVADSIQAVAVVVPNQVVVVADSSRVVVAGVEPILVVAVEIRHSVVPHKPGKSDDQQQSVSHNKDTHSFAA